MQLSFCIIPFCVFDSLCCMPIKKRLSNFFFFKLQSKCVWTSHLWSHEVGHFLSTFRWDSLERWKTQIALAGVISFWIFFSLLFTFCFSQMGLKFCLALNHGAQALGHGGWPRHLPFIIVEASIFQACIGDIHPGAENHLWSPRAIT